MSFRAYDKWTTSVIPVTGGNAAICNHSVMLNPHAHSDAVFLGRHDLAQLLREVCLSDGEALATLAQVMIAGHP